MTNVKARVLGGRLMQRAPGVTMVSTASDRYWREAARLRDKAAAAQDPTVRVELLAMVRQYEVLAESIEDLH